MIVPYVLVRKPLATPRELAHKRTTLLMYRLNMLVQIGFLRERTFAVLDVAFNPLSDTGTFMHPMMALEILL